MDKLDKVFSEYIRLRDADENGYVRCYCCGNPYTLDFCSCDALRK